MDIDLALIALGFCLFVGAFQVSAHYSFTPILVWGGWVMVAYGTLKLWWIRQPDPLSSIMIFGGLMGLGYICFVLARDTGRSANVKDYIQIWERNFETWDGGRPNMAKKLSEKIEGGIVEPKVIRRSFQSNPARFTPLFLTEFDSIQADSVMWITITADGLRCEDDQLGEWRHVRSHTEHGVQFVGYLDKPVYAGRAKSGPDGIIKIVFPIGEYRVDYRVEGRSMKGCDFTRDGHFIVQIYDANKEMEATHHG